MPHDTTNKTLCLANTRRMFELHDAVVISSYSL